MGWRVLILSKTARISCKNNQLLYESDGVDTATIPIEDLSVVIFDTKYIQLTAAILSAFADNGVVLFTSDDSHTPNGIFLPYHSNLRYAEMAKIQVASGESLKKRIWQLIVRQKINNQASVLSLFNKNGVPSMLDNAKRVNSGDTENAEAVAAAVYWKNLFESFVRRDDYDIRNKALNYGYAILRGCVARSLVGTGLLPCFGVHHDNGLNNFNLTDDLIEPFRPFVDFLVCGMDFSGIKELTPNLKQKLISVLLHDCTIGGGKYSVLKAIELSAESLAVAFREKDTFGLKLPEFKGAPKLTEWED